MYTCIRAYGYTCIRVYGYTGIRVYVFTGIRGYVCKTDSELGLPVSRLCSIFIIYGMTLLEAKLVVLSHMKHDVHLYRFISASTDTG